MELEWANLTGIWQGYYLYPEGGMPVPFVATLLESGRFVTGTTHEVGSRGGAGGRMLYALVSGGRSGACLTFVKQYNHVADRIGYDQPIRYDGLLNTDGTEIEGDWSIRYGYGGRFAMSRPLRRRVDAYIEIETPAR